MAGILKRKRSDSELSFSSSTTLSSPPRPAPCFGSPASTTAWHVPMPPMLRGRDTSLHLPGRTLKRYRNNRPSEAEVHEHTLNLLYTAQQTVWQQPPANTGQDGSPHGEADEMGGPSDMDMTDRTYEDTLTHCIDHIAANQPSLHSFWGACRQQSSQGSKPDSMDSKGMNRGY